MEKIRFTFADGSGGDEFFVEDETELLAVSKVFEELLEDVSIEM